MPKTTAHLVKTSQRVLEWQQIMQSVGCSYDGASHLLGEPLLGLVSGDSLEVAELSSSVLSGLDSLSSSAEDNVEVHTEDTGVGIVLDSKINMLLDTESEVSYTQFNSISFSICLGLSIKRIEIAKVYN